MDTCKRMWSENQIGEIAKESGAKVYRHRIYVRIKSDVTPLGDNGKVTSFGFDFISTRAEKFTSLKEIQQFYNWITHGFPLGTSQVVYTNNSSEQGNAYVVILGGTPNYPANVEFRFIPTTHMTTGYISYHDDSKFVQSLSDTVTEV